MNIRFFDFDTDQSVVAEVIYGNNRHYTTSRGIILIKEIEFELKQFLLEYNFSVGVERTPYYRIDAYFNEDSLWILEINASFVDGWGTALNLARANSIQVDLEKLTFPKYFGLKNHVYMPELELFLNELKILGINEHAIKRNYQGSSNGHESIYVYGRVADEYQANIFPYDGVRLDNKINLSLFSRTWNGYNVKIPQHYLDRFCSWEDVPEEVFLKFCDKGGEECTRARQSVLIGKPGGKAKFLRKCYQLESLLAQEVIQPAKHNNNNCQLVILVIGNEIVTGYTQYSQSEIINDNSIHGPLMID